MFWLNILCLFSLNIIKSSAQNNINDSCKDGFENYKNKKLLQICGYKNLEPIVCCKLNNIRETQVENIISIKNKRNVKTKMENMHEQSKELKNEIMERKIGEIAEQKCLEYQQAVFHRSRYPLFSLTNKSAVIRVNKCPIDNHILSPKYNIARDREFPHMGLIGIKNLNGSNVLWPCAGSLISDEFVLTAAQCALFKLNDSVMYVHLGDLMMSQMNENDSKDFTVSEIYFHPDYEPLKVYNDIALLKLNRRVKFNQYIRPACLHVNHEINSHRLIATGWGLKGTNGIRSDIMKKIILLPFTYEECNYIYNDTTIYPQGIIDSLLCAGLIYDKNNIYQGDSGGPLMILHPKIYCMYSIVGITVRGNPLGIAGIPSIFTRVSSYIKWIEDVVWPRN